MKKIIASSLALMLAGSFTFSNGAAYANETDQNVIDLETTVTTDESLSEEDVTKNDSEQTDEIAPALVPGDFFYFIKTVFEKIQLALTVDDVKEAKLLAEFSAERIAEAQSLLAEGEDELAAKVMEESIEILENAQSTIEDETATDEESTEEDTVTEDDATDEETVDEDLDENKDEENIDEDSEEAKDEDSDGLEEVHEVMSQNIIALTAAMNKVKNPVAKAALQKNIDKAYEKLEKKLAKFGYELDKATEEENDQASEEQDLETETEIEKEVNVDEDKDIEDTESINAVTIIPQAPVKVKEKKEKVNKHYQKHEKVHNHDKHKGKHGNHENHEQHGKHGKSDHK